MSVKLIHFVNRSIDCSRLFIFKTLQEYWLLGGFLQRAYFHATNLYGMRVYSIRILAYTNVRMLIYEDRGLLKNYKKETNQ